MADDDRTTIQKLRALIDHPRTGEAERAVARRMLDRARQKTSPPAPRVAGVPHLDPRDPWAQMHALFDHLTAAAEAQRVQQERIRKERRATPEARRVRSEASRRGWAARKAREEAEAEARAAEDAREDEYYRLVGGGPWCDGLDVHPVMGEVECRRPPHAGGDCDDMRGHTWPHYDD
ncbi:hypothetical protein ACIQGZ_17410 [Streptomyces sp. NPDC092296]|uniref:hypothetical protein n=1 Tax=Streptomyces sp. NPDC092296 TaxID=3366012 RepID=UPI00381269FC